MFREIDLFNNENVIIVGDFNTILTPFDKSGGRSNEITFVKSVDVINEYCNSRDLLDIWRERNPNVFKYTWYRKLPKLVMERLDYMLVSSNLSSLVMDSQIDASFCSDHSIPNLWLRSKQVCDSGRGYWKMNTVLLDNEDFVSDCREIINDISHEISDVKLRWEIIKISVRGHAIKFAARKNKSRENKLEALERKQILLHRQLEEKNYTLFLDHEQQLNAISKEIEELIQEKAQKSTFENQLNWYQYGEKSSKYFFNLERTRKKTPLSAVQVGNYIEKDPDNILDLLREYYCDLFTEKNEGWDDKYLENLNIPKITVEESLMLDEPISLAEVEIAINQLKLGKCPRLDGYPVEFYKVFWNDTKHTLHSLFLKVIEDGEFHTSGKEGIISLLEKPGKDQLKIANWRPLTLLCCDYKIFSKVLANRLELVVDRLVNSDQCGFIKNRHIAQNILELNNIILYSNDKQIGATITAIDF